jgi:hypothetical protein
VELDKILIISFIILVIEFVLILNISMVLEYSLDDSENSGFIIYTMDSPNLNNSIQHINSSHKINILDEFNTDINDTSETIPKNYYKIADEIYPDVETKNITSLYNILIKTELPPYTVDYDCSEASAQLEWILEGYGFKTYLATSPYPPPGFNGTSGHMWVIVKLDNGELVAIESTLLTKNNYHPPGIIMGENKKYLKYSYMYHDYISYMQKYSYRNYYVLPKNFTDFIENYYVPPITDCKIELMAHYYYNPPILCDSPEEYISGIKKGNNIYDIPITQFDWWNNPDNKFINS